MAPPSPGTFASRVIAEGENIYCIRWAPQNAKVVWYRLRTDRKNAHRLMAVLKGQSTFLRIEEYGTLIGWGYGEPPPQS